MRPVHHPLSGGALRERDDTEHVLDAIADKDKITVVQIAPAVRAAWGESIGLAPEFATVKGWPRLCANGI